MNIPGLRLSAAADTVPWRDTASPGVRWLLLASEDRPGVAKERLGATVLIQMDPGRGYPPHRHDDVEEVLVLAGGYRDERGEHRAGDYIRYEPGSVHAPIALGDPARPVSEDNPACVLFATARGGISRVTDTPQP